MNLADDYRFAVGQRVVCKAAHYRAGQPGTVVARQPGSTRPGYVVDFGAGLRAFLTEDQLEAHAGPDGTPCSAPRQEGESLISPAPIDRGKTKLERRRPL